MLTYDIHIAIAAPAAQVWRVMADVTRWPEWTPTITAVTLLDGPLRLGARARVEQPRLRPAVYTVTEFTEGRAFTWRMRAPGVTGTATHVVTPTAEGCEVRLAVTFSGLLGGLVGRLAGPLTRDYIRQEAEGLKRRCEGMALARVG